MKSRTNLLATDVLQSIAICCALSLMVFPVDLFGQKTDQCYECHSGLDDAASKAFAKSIHYAKHLSCADCHGGNRNSDDMDKAMSKTAGFIGVPKKNTISKACATCHNNEAKMKRLGAQIITGQFSKLATSVHGAGGEDQFILQCTDCHGSHDIVRAHDPGSRVAPLKVVQLCSKCHNDPAFIRQYNPSLQTDQLAKYRTSVHGMRNAKGDSKVATCASCHTAHDIRRSSDSKSSIYAANIPTTCGYCHSDVRYMKQYGIPTDQVAKYTESVHGKALLIKHDASAPACNDCHGNHGAIPPGIESISNVCGTCHALNAELFRSSPHKAVFAERGLPECETCHGNHGIQPAGQNMLAVGQNTLCGKCHSPTEGPKGYKAALQMNALLDSLMFTTHDAEVRLNIAEQKGMEIEDIRFSLRDARQARLQSRTAVHAFNLGQFREVVDKGLKIATTAQTDASEANSEYYFRRWGLAIATLVITFLAVLLFFYIRRIERHQNTASS